MEYRRLGLSGCVVSSLAPGTMTFGSESDERTSHAQLDAFVDAGGTLVDTADVYSAGASEEIIGRWLRKQTDARRSQRPSSALHDRGVREPGDPGDRSPARLHGVL